MADTSSRSSEIHNLQCKEIWGGIQAVDQPFHVPGLAGRIFCRPYRGDAGGGDIHFIGLCGKGFLSRFVVADVSGHGESVAEQASRLRSLLARHMDNPDMAELTGQINRQLSVGPDSSGQFATALVMSYLSPNRHLLTINAGHPRPLWFRAGQGLWHLLDSTIPEADIDEVMNLPLGVLSQTGYRQFAVQLEADDLLIAYTDSLIEARDARGQALGEKGLLDLAGQIDTDRSPAEILEDLLARVRDVQDGDELGDDVTVLVFSHDGQVPEYDLD
jgi:serine phosphatase RsbU (regulator of sigma subunit)